MLANSIVQPFETFLDYNQFSLFADTEQLVTDSNGTHSAVFARLHEQVAALTQRCSVKWAMSDECKGLELVQMINMLGRVRKWFLYDPETPTSAWGLFMLELYCRMPSHGANTLRRETNQSQFDRWCLGSQAGSTMMPIYV